MSFSVSNRGDVCIVEVEGQLIVGNRQELKQKILDELEKGSRKVLVDFARTGYIDSSGLGELVSVYTTVRNKQGDVKLLNLTSKAKDLLQMTKPEPREGFLEIFTVKDDAEAQKLLETRYTKKPATLVQ